MSGVLNLLLASKGDILRLDAGTYTDTPTSGGDNVNFTLQSGTHGAQAQTSMTANGNANLYQWIKPAANGNNYEVRATVTSGSLSVGTTGTFQRLNADRTWGVAASGFSSQNAVFTLDIRAFGGSTILASASISITAISLS